MTSNVRQSFVGYAGEVPAWSLFLSYLSPSHISQNVDLIAIAGSHSTAVLELGGYVGNARLQFSEKAVPPHIESDSCCLFMLRLNAYLNRSWRNVGSGVKVKKILMILLVIDKSSATD